MGYKFNPLIYSGFDKASSGGGGGGSSTIGGPVVGSTPFTVLRIDSGGNLDQIGPLTDGQLIIGDTGGPTVANTLTGTANQVSIANGAGSITLSLPQDIAAASSPTFVGATFSGLTASQPVKTNGSKQLISALIVNADVDPAAAISLSKLAALTANRALQSDGSGVISVSLVTNTELGYSSGVTSAIQTQLNSKLNLSGGSMSGSIDMNGNSITDLPAPSAPDDAATKGYVDALAEGLKPKAAVRAGSLANIDLTTGGLLTIDTVVLLNNDRVLVKDQTLPAQNGIYLAHAGSWTRSLDFDSLTPIDEINGAYTFIQEGSQQAQGWVQTGVVAVLNTDPIEFVFFNSTSGLIGGNGIDITGNVVSVDHDGQGLTFSGAQLALELDSTTLSKSASGLKVATGGITNTEVSASAAIVYSKLNLSNSIVNADINAVAAIAYSKLNLANSIVNADIAAGAAIARSKLASGTAFALISNDGAGALSSLGPLTDGQLLIGDTGASAVAATLTAGTGISIINAAGSITISATSTGSSPGDINQTTFAGANNQSSPAVVMGFLFNDASVRSFKALVSATVDATSDLYEGFQLHGIQKNGSWEMTTVSVGDNSQVNFTIDATGQILYTSGNYSGFVSLDIRFRAIVTNL